MPLTISRALLVPVLVAVAAACSSDRPTPEPRTAPQVAAPVASPAELPSAAAEQALVLIAQPGWIAEQPSSAMRKAQFRLPRADSDSEDASLVVYFFGSQAGSREANLERWAGQFEQTDGAASSEAMKNTTRKVAGLEVLDVALSGTYVAETAPGSGERVNKPGWRMLASIVETREGPWYFKLVGPAATVSKWEASYDACLSSIRPGR